MAIAATELPQPPHPYLVEKWKLSRKESSSAAAAAAAMKSAAPPHRRCSFTRKCASLVKEQRARFYIMRRCVTMLICWRDLTDS